MTRGAREAKRTVKPLHVPLDLAQAVSNVAASFSWQRQPYAQASDVSG